mmetsp:Transcript_21337/g.34329  ORF Transcript_21337/g.34329 Transcript_21337/m.34329 type:complete len:222 (+) Transcript_21337:1134-1799(+)
MNKDVVSIASSTQECKTISFCLQFSSTCICNTAQIVWKGCTRNACQVTTRSPKQRNGHIVPIVIGACRNFNGIVHAIHFIPKTGTINVHSTGRRLDGGVVGIYRGSLDTTTIRFHGQGLRTEFVGLQQLETCGNQFKVPHRVGCLSMNEYIVCDLILRQPPCRDSSPTRFAVWVRCGRSCDAFQSIARSLEDTNGRRVVITGTRAHTKGSAVSGYLVPNSR